MGEGSQAGPAAGLTPDTPVLLFDGECGLCARGVQFLLRHDRRRGIWFAPLQGEYGAGVRSRHPELAGVDSMVWVSRSQGRERLFLKSAAALEAARHLGGLWRLADLCRIVPPGMRDRAYDVIARHRHSVFGARACLVPTPDQRARFLP